MLNMFHCTSRVREVLPKQLSTNFFLKIFGQPTTEQLIFSHFCHILTFNVVLLLKCSKFQLKKKRYSMCMENVAVVFLIRVVKQRFPEENLTKFRVKHVLHLFEDTGSVRKPKRVLNKRITENRETVAVVLNEVNENPNISIRFLAFQLLSFKAFKKIINIIRRKFVCTKNSWK